MGREVEVEGKHQEEYGNRQIKEHVRGRKK